MLEKRLAPIPGTSSSSRLATAASQIPRESQDRARAGLVGAHLEEILAGKLEHRRDLFQHARDLPAVHAGIVREKSRIESQELRVGNLGSGLRRLRSPGDEDRPAQPFDVSDGLDSPAELVRRMADAGIDAFALTDHDTLQGLPEAREEAERARHRAHLRAPRSRRTSRARTTSTSSRSSWTRTTSVQREPRGPAGEPAHAAASAWPRSSSRRGSRSTSTRSARTSATASGAARTSRARSSGPGYASSNDEAFDRLPGPTSTPGTCRTTKWQAVDVLAGGPRGRRRLLARPLRLVQRSRRR